MNILVTGGTGYIGSHTIIELLENGHSVIVADNLSNSTQESLRRVESITNTSIPFYELDLRDRIKLEEVFAANSIDAVIHFAGLKAVGESVAKPLMYYANNLDSTLVLLDIMWQYNVKKIVFSSSATVYTDPTEVPWSETSKVGDGIASPYGRTKYMIDQILTDVSISDKDFEVTILRYFNPVGAHPSGLIGEDPNGIPNNLLPYIAQVAVGKLANVQVFGNDYDTRDGTGVRDYIHVVDLAKGHLAAINHSKPGTEIYNLGAGKGTSVLELIDSFSKAAGKEIPYRIAPRRAGDIASFYANPEKANRMLDWKAERSIDDACEDTWRWQSRNPNGFKLVNDL